MITIVDYGLGNIAAFRNTYERFGIPVTIAKSAKLLAEAERIILPGVGSFDWAMERLDRSGMRDTLDELVLERKRPVLGVCVGMQIMAKASDEGSRPGLGWFDATVRRFPAESEKPVLLPHMGWNDVAPKPAALFAGLESPRFYFLHSYYFQCANPEDTLAQTNYGGLFASAAATGHILGVQFHPEKSHHWGGRLLKNFAGIQ